MTLAREKPLAEPASKARLRLWLRLLRVTREVEGALREKLRRDHGTTLPRFDVMSALSRNPGGLKMSELSGVLRVSNGNVTGIIERLVDEGHVLRSAVDGDRRAFSVRLTDQGRAEFARQAAEHEAWIDAALSAIGPEDANEITRALGALSGRKG